MKNILKLEVAEELKPDYEFWIRQGYWDLRQAMSLLLDIEPRIYDEQFRRDKTELDAPEGLADAFKEMASLLKRGLFLHSELKTPQEVLLWVVQKKIPIPKGIEEAADEILEMGLKKARLGKMVDYNEWLLRDLWELEESIVLIRGYVPGMNRTQEEEMEIRKFYAMAQDGIELRKIPVKRIKHYGLNPWTEKKVEPKHILEWARLKNIIVPEPLKKAALDFQSASLPSEPIIRERGELHRNKKEKTNREEPHGNTIHNEKRRTEVLGAALAVLAEFKDDCIDRNGKIQGAKIAKAIDEKAPLFWSDDLKPPLSEDRITRLINGWLGKVKKSRK